MNKIIFLIQCPDCKGILYSTVGWFSQRGFNILHCQQHTDSYENMFFMRIELDAADLRTSRSALEQEFSEYAAEHNLKWSCSYSDYKARVAIMVSKTSHCLFDLLSRHAEGELYCDIPIIISNHNSLEEVASQFRIPFIYLPIENGDKESQEQEVRKLLRQFDIDLVVLARYMQILSADFTSEWEGRIINIHHAFLPAFQGANPYKRAYERGVKMIGATAHYASQDLDQGPIIEQDVVRVNHELTPQGLMQTGKDVEKRVLARAVAAHLESRVIVYQNRTVVFAAEH